MEFHKVPQDLNKWSCLTKTQNNGAGSLHSRAIWHYYKLILSVFLTFWVIFSRSVVIPSNTLSRFLVIILSPGFVSCGLKFSSESLEEEYRISFSMFLSISRKSRGYNASSSSVSLVDTSNLSSLYCF